MSSTIKFYCNFCGKQIISNSTDEDTMGWCQPPGWVNEGCFSNDLRSNVEGPHICQTCINITIVSKGNLK